jgi:hypothetical protein
MLNIPLTDLQLHFENGTSLRWPQLPNPIVYPQQLIVIATCLSSFRIGVELDIEQQDHDPLFWSHCSCANDGAVIITTEGPASFPREPASGGG